MAAKKKTNNNYVPSAEDIKRLRTQVSTRQPSATIGKPTVDPSKGKAPSYPNQQKTFDALNKVGKFTTEAAMIGLGTGALVKGAAKLAAKGAGKYVGKVSTEEAYKVNMKGLWNATGMGGKVSRTQTPMGPTLRSTEIGTAKQQAARIGNLEINAVKKSDLIGGGTQGRISQDILKVGKVAKKVGTGLGPVASGAKNRPKKK
jgi:hypothetical protein